MAIPQKKYIAITSANADKGKAKNKDLIARVLTTNPLFGVNVVTEFSDAETVANFAGATSAEAKFAAEYFGWTSKKAEKAKKISFMRYSKAAVAPFIRGTVKTPDLATLKAISNGSLVVNMGGTSYSISGTSFTSAADYAAVASALQTKVRANTAGGSLWTSATVTYEAGSGSFILTGGSTGSAEIAAATATGSGTDLSSLLGWNAESQPVLSPGSDAMTLTDILNKTVNVSDNFLTVGFLTAADAISDLDTIGSWVTTQNNQYRFCFDVGSSNYTTAIATAAKYEGMTANYNINYGVSGVNPAWLMTAVLPATTNYDKENAVKNYMFQSFPQQAISVGTDDDGDLYKTLDGLNINYNGQTQKAGLKIAFYQNGFNADGVDSAVFDNEAWLKDAIATDVLNTFIGLDFVSADIDGKPVIVGILQENAEKALTNHVFSKGRVLTNEQKGYITQLTGDDTAWLSVQNNGYVFDVDFTTETEGNQTIHVAEYTLIYEKNDVIRKVVGRNILV